MLELLEQFASWLGALPPTTGALVGLGVLLAVGILVDLLIKSLLVGLMRKAAQHTAFEWDDILVEYNVIGRSAQVIPALVIYFGAQALPQLSDQLIDLIGRLSLAAIALIVAFAVSALLNAVNAAYNRYPIARDRPIRGFIQIAKIVVFIFGGVVAVAVLMNKSPAVLLTGFGAMTAIVLLIFRDTILSFVANIQLASLDMVRVGDWIEMPKYDANGDVIDVALHTVKVQNWDKTITTIPTHALISESFKNWRGMRETGGRRIKRSINVDVNSVRFLDDAEIDRFRQFRLLEDYIEERQTELADYNQRLGDTANVNLRRLTNIGTFRAYLKNYVSNHPRIHNDMTLMVRQLQPAESGMPLEIYCFTNTTDWTTYETVQADIFDHILAQAREFGLRIFQAPAGADIRALGGEAAVHGDAQTPIA